MLNLLELISLTVYTLFMLVFLCVESWLSILLVTELVWINLYSLYVICGLYLSVTKLITISLFILILAAIDCSIWLLLLINLFYCSNTKITISKTSILKFYLRAQRKLYLNTIL